MVTPAEQPARMKSLNRFADPVFCIMRLLVGIMLSCHGAQKVFGMFGGKVMTGGMLIFGWFELICGILIALGLLTRVGALLASGIMAIAYFKAHFPGGFLPIVNHGELAVVYCWLFLFIFFYGPGRWSVDALIRGGKPASATPIP
jgi:putative oxidoreductase